MEHYMQNKEHGRMILESVENGPLIWPTIEENGVTRTKKYAELSAAEKIQADCDMKATNIILQGLPADIYSLVNHHRVAKDLWERVQLLMQGTSLTKQERECKLYDAFDKFTHIKGESLHKYYLRFTQLINDMNIYNIKMEQFQVNTKFLNSLPPEWSKFVTDVKLVKDLHTTNFDQLHAYLEQHELHANEVRLLRERNQDPLAFVANQQMTPPHFNTYQSSYNNPQIPQQFPPSQYGSIHPNQHYPSTYLSQPQFNHSSIQPSYPYQFPLSNNQLRTSSNLRNQATIQDGRVTVQQVHGRQGQSYSGTRYKSNATSYGENNASGQARVVKCYNCQGERHMARHCTQLKRPRNAAWYKDKAMLAEAQEAGQILDEEQLSFLANPGDLDTYDSDCDDISNAKAVLMVNISNYGSNVISEVPHSETYLNDMENQSVHAMQDFEQRLNIDLSSREKMIDSQMDDMIKEKLALKEQVDSLEQNLSKQIKEKECLLQTFNVFKSESKEKEDKYMKNEIDFKPSDASPVKIESPKDHPEVSLVNESLKKLKFHLARFDNVMKIRTAPDARTKDAVVQQSSVDKQCLKIAKKDLLLENDRLLQQIMSQDVLLTVMNSMSLIGEFVNVERKRNESCDKCVNPEAELLKSQNVFNDLLKSYSQFEKHCISLELSIKLNQEIFQKDVSFNNQNALEILEFFENNDLKAQLQDKDSTICKLKDIIKSMRVKSKDENVNYDYCEIETKNVELENSVAKLLLKNKRLCNEINHVKQVFKEQFDSIKQIRVRTKEHSDSLIDKLNLKSAENEDLKAQIQDKVFVITSLKNDLRKIKGKEIVDVAAKILSANAIVLVMFKLDLEPLAPRGLKGFVVPVFSLGDDPIAYLNKEMAFLTAGRQGQSYSGSGYKNNATIYEGNNASGQARVVKCYNCQGEGHMARKCTQPKRPRNAAWYKDKAMLGEAQKVGQILDVEQLAFLASSRGSRWSSCSDPIHPNNVAFQTEDLNTYDFDCDDISNAKAILMANISNYGFNVISKANVQDTNLQTQQDSMILSMIEQIKPSNASPVKIEAPKELPKVSLVNESLKKLKLHLARFDNVVKIRTTPDARTEGEWGLNILKLITLEMIDSYNNQSQDVLLTVMNSMSLFGESVNMDRKRKESYEKCFNLEAELLKSQNAFNDLLKEMFKLDLEPLALRLLQNKEAHIDYLKYTQEHAGILRGIVKQAKAEQPLDMS
ncbi:retrovirus-related pol polyprotein from transposon TNT 1-94 [Tanacetum coccineum]